MPPTATGDCGSARNAPSTKGSSTPASSALASAGGSRAVTAPNAPVTPSSVMTAALSRHAPSTSAKLACPLAARPAIRAMPGVVHASSTGARYRHDSASVPSPMAR